jgi:hypothetical protein
MTNNINEIQRLNLELIKKASFNSFNGEKVVKDLIDNKKLWEGVVMDREGFGHIDLIKLRDIADGYWNISTMFILFEKENKDALMKLVKNWEADEIDILTQRESQNFMGYRKSEDTKLLLRVWWD